MSDPVTNNYGLTQPTVGGDLNTWGGVLNSAVIGVLDTILGANLAVSITSNDVTLTTSQFQNAIFVVSGALTGNRNLIIPLSPNSVTLACGGHFVVVNNTTGNFNLTVLTAATASTGVVVPQGFTAFLYSDGTNVGFCSNGLPGYALASAGNPNGVLAGTAASINTNASIAYDYINNVIYFCTTTGTALSALWSQPQIVINRGFDTAINLSLAATHTGGNLLSVAVKTVAGTDPTTLNPVTCEFQTLSGSNTTGGVTSVSITGALSMNTNATGASLGSVNNTPFRIWLALFNNAGSPVLAMQNCSTASAIYPLAEYGVASTTSISNTATSAGVWYTPNGTALTNCAFRIIGYVEYTSGLATVGSYTSDPSNVVIFGPGIKKPGDVVQTVSLHAGSVASVSFNSTPTSTNITLNIAPTSPINLVRYDVSSTSAFNSNSGNFSTAQMYRGSTPIGVLNKFTIFGSGTFPASINFVGIDNPNTTALTTYVIKGATNGTGNGGSIPAVNTDGATEILQEIMG